MEAIISLLCLASLGCGMLIMPESQHQDTLRWQPVNLNTTTSTLPVNASIVYKQLERVTVIPGDIDMTFFVINSPEIGNEGAHIKYGNKVPCQPRKEINKPFDKLYRKGMLWQLLKPC